MIVFTMEDEKNMKKSKTTQPKIRYEPEADVLTWELSGKQIYSAQKPGNVGFISLKMILLC